MGQKKLFGLTALLIASYFSYITLTAEHGRSVIKYEKSKNNNILSAQNNDIKINSVISADDGKDRPNSYNKNGMTYIEPPSEVLHGGLAQHYQKLKLEADSGNAQSAYLLGINLSKCLSVPLDIDAARDSIEHGRSIIPAGGKNYNEFSSASESTIMRDYYYCEGITQEQRLEFFNYIKMAITGGDIYAASSQLDFYSLVEITNKTSPPEERQKLLEKYIVEYRMDMVNASKRGSVPAILLLAQAHVDEYSILRDNNALVEALKYYLVLSDYADNEFQSYIQERIKSQKEYLTPREVDFAEEKSFKLKYEIENNKTIYKFKVKNN